MDTTDLSTCLACGAELAPCLRLGGSPRCHDCRSSNAPLRPELAQPEAREAA